MQKEEDIAFYSIKMCIISINSLYKSIGSFWEHLKYLNPKHHKGQGHTCSDNESFKLAWMKKALKLAKLKHQLSGVRDRFDQAGD